MEIDDNNVLQHGIIFLNPGAGKCRPRYLVTEAQDISDEFMDGYLRKTLVTNAIIKKKVKVIIKMFINHNRANLIEID